MKVLKHNLPAVEKRRQALFYKHILSSQIGLFRFCQETGKKRHPVNPVDPV
jgi:hypothetical protein